MEWALIFLISAIVTLVFLFLPSVAKFPYKLGSEALAAKIMMTAILTFGLFGMSLWTYVNPDLFTPVVTPIEPGGGGLTIVAGDNRCDAGEYYPAEPACAPLPVGSSTACACKQTTDSTFSLLMREMYYDYRVGGNHKISVAGGGWETLANEGTKALTPGTKVKIAAVGNSSVFNKVIEGYVPCAPTSNIRSLLTSWDPCGQELSAIDPNVDKMYMNGTVTMTVYNRANSQLSSTVNETIGAGDARPLKIELAGQQNYAFPYGAICIDEYNSSEFTYGDVLSTGFAGATDLGNYKPNSFALAAVDDVVHSYQLGPIIGNVYMAGTITPTTVATSTNPNDGNIKLDCYGRNYCYNRNTKDYELKIEDIDNSYCYLGAFEFTMTYN